MAKIDTPKFAIPWRQPLRPYGPLSRAWERALVSIDSLFGFSLIALGIAVTPGSNMVYVVARALIQGRTAGMIALAGVLLGSLGYLAPAALGVGVLLSTVPRAYDALRIAGASYLGYLAWKAVFSAGWTNLDARPLKREGHAKVFGSGALVGLLNPAAALFYLTVIPKFVDPTRGSVPAQTLVLGTAYILINGSAKAIIVVVAGALARLTTLKSAFARVQGWATAIALTILALNLGLDARQSSLSAATGSTQQIKITAAHQTDAVANETDRRIPEARSPPSVLLDTPQSEQRDRDGAIAGAAEPAISRPQACAETSKSLLGEFRLFGPLAFVQVSPKAKRRLRAERRRLIERQH